MSASLRSRVRRLETLEERSAPDQPLQVLLGTFHPLPEGFIGERHVAVINRRISVSGQTWCEFEERPGPVQCHVRCVCFALAKERCLFLRRSRVRTTHRHMTHWTENDFWSFAQPSRWANLPYC
jgi:hypothetical protein